MRPSVLSKLIGAVALYWIVYESWPASLVAGITIVAICIIVAIARTLHRKSRVAGRGTVVAGRPAVKSGQHEPLKGTFAMPRLELAPILSPITKLSPSIMHRSGSLFYSGPSAFEASRSIYILGLNPGGSPSTQVDETVERDFTEWQALTKPWSAYVDESWQGRSPGTHGMQPRMRHMFSQLGLDLREVPASNVVFVRSTNEAALAAEKAALLSQCWPVHEAVIRELEIRTILCLGTTAGRWTREAIRADKLIDRFKEQNDRGWASEAHIAADGRAVVTVTHPGRADWRNPLADPTPLVRAVLSRRC